MVRTDRFSGRTRLGSFREEEAIWRGCEVGRLLYCFLVQNESLINKRYEYQTKSSSPLPVLHVSHSISLSTLLVLCSNESLHMQISSKFLICTISFSKVLKMLPAGALPFCCAILTL